MREILLQNRGLVALVDDCDFDRLNEYHWWASYSGNRSKTFYAFRSGYKTNIDRSPRRMHLDVLQIEETETGVEVDHIDRNGLNNQRNNLRISTRLGNCVNQGLRKDNKSGFRGVSWDSKSKKWSVRLKAGGIYLNLGLYADKAEAAMVYAEKAVECFGEFCPKEIKERLRQ